jgi:hypothetical protein
MPSDTSREDEALSASLLPSASLPSFANRFASDGRLCHSTVWTSSGRPASGRWRELDRYVADAAKPTHGPEPKSHPRASRHLDYHQVLGPPPASEFALARMASGPSDRAFANGTRRKAGVITNRDIINCELQISRRRVRAHASAKLHRVFAIRLRLPGLRPNLVIADRPDFFMKSRMARQD